MELEVAAVLRDSQHDLPNDQELTMSEQKALLKLSLEEVMMTGSAVYMYMYVCGLSVTSAHACIITNEWGKLDY